MVDIGKDFYEEKIENDFQFMRYLQTDVGKIQGIRETFADDWELEELTRSIIFAEVEIIQMLKGGIENGREDLKKLG